MCKEYKRKYQEYLITITYLNGDKENLKYKGINTSNYNDMLNLYRDIKEQYKNESVIIDFIGKSADGELGILFQKKIINKDAELKERASKIQKMSLEEILENLINSFNILKEKKQFAIKNRDVYTKEIDIKLHIMEDKERNGEYVPPEEKIKVYDMIAKERVIRRNSKNDKFKLDNLRNSLQQFKNINTNESLCINSIIEILQTNIESINKINLDSKKYNLTYEKAEKLKIMKKVKYKNFKERIKLIAELKKEYQKVYYDDSKMEVICYNKAKAC
ncbi:hypothetical protein EJM73_09090 [Clostridium botulinum]|uniref:hypothetical protein n=1 Tax=Clostridium botulinum TaxID=1491 RepID=UPI0013758405|nr:hypothetical protein [Clostridium botulinum]NCI19780.1 hypothetical protein [Clostridium botulinum]NCI35818.1 hypothetical protein [Clostridium botulinum]NCI71675.1 hypothetical protein [Clostridium botulinum]NDI38867.1 hypothetical protein [Clostridium botulinum]